MFLFVRMCVWLFVCVWVPTEARPEDGIKSCKVGLTSDCEQSNLDAGN